MANKRKHYIVGFKAQTIREILQKEKTIGQLASEMMHADQESSVNQGMLDFLNFLIGRVAV